MKYFFAGSVLFLVAAHSAQAAFVPGAPSSFESFSTQLSSEGLQNLAPAAQAALASSLGSIKALHDVSSATGEIDQYKLSPELLGVLFGAAQLSGATLPPVANDFKSKLLEADVTLNYGAENYAAFVSLSSEVDYSFPPVDHPKPTDPVEAIFPTTLNYQASWSNSTLTANAASTEEAVKIHTRLNIGNIYVKALEFDFSEPGVVSGKVSIVALGGLYKTDIKFSFKL
jgi:hypothetical protein